MGAIEVVLWCLMLANIVLLGLWCSTLGKRIDTVHKRISLNSRTNGLVDRWDDVPPNERKRLL